MRIRIELDDTLSDIEVIIRSPKLSADITRLQEILQQAQQPPLIFYKGTSEYFIALDDILFLKRMARRFTGILRTMLMK